MANDAISYAKSIRVPPPPGAPYSVPVPGSQQPGRSAVYRHWRFKDELLRTLDPEVTTTHELFESSCRRWPNNRCLGYRPYDQTSKTWGPYQWLDYATVQKRRADFGAGLVELHQGVGVTEGKYGVGLWCQNRPEWQITDLGCMSQALFTVSIYDTLGPETTEYIINHAQLTCVVASLNHIPTLLKLKPKLPTLKLIISMDSIDHGELPGHTKRDLLGAWAGDQGVQLHYMADVEALGQAKPRPYNPPRPTDLVTINYTSGTTGAPKGVMLTHSNAIAAGSSAQVHALQTPKDVVVSYMPLAHIYERVGQHGSLWGGAGIAFFHGNILELPDDLKLVRPTAFHSVPRLFNRFGSAIRAATVEQSGVRGALSKHVVSSKLQTLNSANPTNKHALYDRIWGRKVSAAIGLDRAKQMISGSAPIDPSLQQFLRIVFGNTFIQGYGLTETYAVSLGQIEGDFSAGNCGAVTPCMELCLLDVPDMEYHSTDKPNPRGELLVRGNALFKAYHRNDAETSKAMLPDGWFRTGDVASVDSMGRFTIIDRVKNVLKLAQGEYVSPERIENVYLSNCSYLAQAYVHGDSVHSFLVAIFGVSPEQFAVFAGKVLGKHIDDHDEKTLQAAAHDERVRKAVIRDLDKVGRKNKFTGYERVRNVFLFLEPFSIENELLTPTLKLKRPQTAKRYRADLDKLYEEAHVEEAKKPKAKL